MAKLWRSEHCGHDLNQIDPNPVLRSAKLVALGLNDQGLGDRDGIEGQDRKPGAGLGLTAIGIAHNFRAMVRLCFAKPARVMVRAFGFSVALILCVNSASYAQAVRPANADFAGAVNLNTSGLTQTLRLEGSLANSEELRRFGGSDVFGNIIPNVTHANWFRWRATSTGFVQFTLQFQNFAAVGSTGLIDFQVFDGDTFNAITLVNRGSINLGLLGTTATQRAGFDSISGRNYIIRVFAGGTPLPLAAGGSVTLIPANPVFANDAFVNASPLPEAGLRVQSTLTGATDYSGPNFEIIRRARVATGVSETFFSRNRWWRFQPTQSGLATIDWSASPSRAIGMAVHVGDRAANLVAVGQPNALILTGGPQLQTRQISFQANVGQVYYVEVYDLESAVEEFEIGTFDFTFGFTPSAPVAAAPSTSIIAATLPAARASTQIAAPLTVFATIINAGNSTARNCRIEPGFVLRSLRTDLTFTVPSFDFLYQTTNAQNQLAGVANRPIDVPPGAAQGFLIAVTGRVDPTLATFTFASQVFAPQFLCDNAAPAPITPGTNTFSIRAPVALSANTVTTGLTPVADIIPIAATPDAPGIVNIPGTGARTGFFAVSAVNIGATSVVNVSTTTFGVPQPFAVAICETNPATGQCITPLAGGSISINFLAGQVRSFSVFLQSDSSQSVSFAPAVNRVGVQFRQGSATGVSGETSVAVRTVP